MIRNSTSSHEGVAWPHGFSRYGNRHPAPGVGRCVAVLPPGVVAGVCSTACPTLDQEVRVLEGRQSSELESRVDSRREVNTENCNIYRTDPIKKTGAKFPDPLRSLIMFERI